MILRAFLGKGWALWSRRTRAVHPSKWRICQVHIEKTVPDTAESARHTRLDVTSVLLKSQLVSVVDQQEVANTIKTVQYPLSPTIRMDQVASQLAEYLIQQLAL